MSESNIRRELRWPGTILPRGITGPGVLPAVKALGRLAGRADPPADVEVHRVGPITVRVHRPSTPADGNQPALLWIHGGGFVMGLAAQDDQLCREYARRTGAVVAAVDYRLAPEHPYPTPLHDCHDALVWLAERPGIDAERIAIGGASAGGGLAAGLAILALERGQVRPVLQLLAYPMLDDSTALRTDVDQRGFRLWNLRSNLLGWRSYLGIEPGTPGIAPAAAPARADSLVGLPTAWIGVGSLDLFHDEDVAYAGRLVDAGVPCTLDVIEGAYHAFDAFSPGATVSRIFRDAQVSALRHAFDA